MRYFKVHSFLFAIVAMALASCSEQFLENAPMNTAQNRNIQQIEPAVVVNKIGIPNDSYIVVFKDSITTTELKNEVAGLERRFKAIPEFVYSKAIKGFAARLSPEALAELRRNPLVDFIEKDQEISLNVTASNVPSWGLDRIDQANLPLNTSFVYTNSGLGVKAYVIDTGILLSHNEFGTRAIGGFSAINSSTDWTDGNGHGTHVAGTIGGLNYGVARSVTLVAVRVLDANGSGTNSGVIAGINWAITDHLAGEPAVANMSLGGGASSALDLAVENAINDGIVMCVAAGNNTADAGRYSPARVRNAITVGATGRFTSTGPSYDAIASYSNFGSVIDVFAPGTNINSAFIRSTSDINTLSGTSMAAPHVAGVIAQYLTTNKAKTPAEVATYIKSVATPRKVTGIKGTTTTTALLYTNN